MWYKLNDMMGLVLLIAVVGGGAIYGLVVFIDAPPLLRQEGDPENQYQRQARQDLQKRLNKLRDQQSDALEKAAGYGRQWSN